MSRKNILIANSEGELVYLNNSIYSLLDLQSDDVLNKKLEDLIIPDSIIETFELAIKRRSKIENAHITIARRKKILNEDTNEYVYKDEGEPYHGFANVVPIRAKESKSDYYMMIIADEVFA
jgi:transcriptional regulator with PAS, ATPase and Fis domain